MTWTTQYLMRVRRCSGLASSHAFAMLRESAMMRDTSAHASSFDRANPSASLKSRRAVAMHALAATSSFIRGSFSSSWSTSTSRTMRASLS
ncbi:MAG: hypothetical protein JWR63_4515 [Conexibacter sp.]|nr:hypothetical protein [Conexibacter sp.]